MVIERILREHNSRAASWLPFGDGYVESKTPRRSRLAVAVAKRRSEQRLGKVDPGSASVSGREGRRRIPELARRDRLVEHLLGSADGCRPARI